MKITIKNGFLNKKLAYFNYKFNDDKMITTFIDFLFHLLKFGRLIIWFFLFTFI